MSRRKNRTPWMDVTNDLPIDVTVGQVLRFNQGGDIVSLRIMRIKNGKIWAKYVDTYDKDQIQDMAREAEEFERAKLAE